MTCPFQKRYPHRFFSCCLDDPTLLRKNFVKFLRHHKATKRLRLHTTMPRDSTYDAPADSPRCQQRICIGCGWDRNTDCNCVKGQPNYKRATSCGAPSTHFSLGVWWTRHKEPFRKEGNPAVHWTCDKHVDGTLADVWKIEHIPRKEDIERNQV